MQGRAFKLSKPRVQTAGYRGKSTHRTDKQKTAASLMVSLEHPSMQLSYYRDIPLTSTKRNKKVKKLNELLGSCTKQQKFSQQSPWALKNNSIWKLKLEGTQISNSKYHQPRARKTIAVPMTNVPAVGDYENSDAPTRRKITFGYTFRGRYPGAKSNKNVKKACEAGTAASSRKDRTNKMGTFNSTCSSFFEYDSIVKPIEQNNIQFENMKFVHSINIDSVWPSLINKYNLTGPRISIIALHK